MNSLIDSLININIIVRETNKFVGYKIFVYFRHSRSRSNSRSRKRSRSRRRSTSRSRQSPVRSRRSRSRGRRSKSRSPSKPKAYKSRYTQIVRENRVTNKGWDFRDDCTEFILSLYSWFPATVNLFLSLQNQLISH